MKANKAKAKAWRMEQKRKQAEAEIIAKAIRRHTKTPHGFEKWGKIMSILRTIHREIDPIIKQKRDAEDYLFFASGRHSA